MFYKFNNKFNESPEGIQQFLEHVNSQPKREPKSDLKGVPMGDGSMFTQHRIDKINDYKKEALEANIIKNGKPRVTGSHGY